nr:putative ribonuclease H-like domain-containing protein [Tanacetum cinerariifolium]
MTPEILKYFIAGIENQIDNKVKTIKCDNGTEFKNRIMNEFYEMKGIRREFSVARTPQQNGVTERKNRTLIEAVRTMLADSKLPTTFWAEEVNTACYVQNRVLVIKPHNKTHYEIFLCRKPALSFMRPFGCHVTILNTVDHLGNQSNGNAGTKANIDAGQARKKTDPAKEGDKNDQENDVRDQEEAIRKQFEQEYKRLFGQGKAATTNSTNKHNTDSSPVNAVSSSFTTIDPGRERAQRNEFESMFVQDKDANGNRMFTPISATGSTYVNLGGSIHVNAATLPNADLSTDPLMPALEALLIFRILESLVVHIMMKLRVHRLILTTWNSPQLVFAPVARIEAIRLFLAYASFMGFIVYQMDVNSAFLYDTIEEEVYVCQPLGFEDPYFPDKVYKVEKALYGLHQAPKAWSKTFST